MLHEWRVLRADSHATGFPHAAQWHTASSIIHLIVSYYSWQVATWQKEETTVCVVFFLINWFHFIWRGRGRVGEDQQILHLLVLSPNACHNWRQEPETNFMSPMCMEGTTCLNHHLVFPRYTLAGSCDPKWSQDWKQTLQHGMQVSEVTFLPLIQCLPLYVFLFIVPSILTWPQDCILLPHVMSWSLWCFLSFAVHSQDFLSQGLVRQNGK